MKKYKLILEFYSQFKEGVPMDNLQTPNGARGFLIVIAESYRISVSWLPATKRGGKMQYECSKLVIFKLSLTCLHCNLITMPQWEDYKTSKGKKFQWNGVNI